MGGKWEEVGRGCRYPPADSHLAESSAREATLWAPDHSTNPKEMLCTVLYTHVISVLILLCQHRQETIKLLHAKLFFVIPCLWNQLARLFCVLA